MEKETDNSQIKCEICFLDYDINTKIPIRLKCGHNLCNECLNLLKSKNTSLLICPFCRKEFNSKETSRNLNLTWKINNNDDSCNQKWKNLLCPNNHLCEFTKILTTGSTRYLTQTYCS